MKKLLIVACMVCFSAVAQQASEEKQLQKTTADGQEVSTNQDVVDVPELSPDVVEKMQGYQIGKVESKDDSTAGSSSSEDKANKENVVAVYDEILAESGELKKLGVTSVAQLPNDVYAKVVSELLTKLTPPELIKLSRRLNEQKRKAQVEPLREVTALSVTDVLNVDNSKHIQKIKVVPGYTTTIEFYDNAGNPWPIAEQASGDDIFDIKRPEIAPHTLRVSAKSDFRETNLTYLLAGIPTSFRLILSAVDEADSAMSARQYHDIVRYTVPLVSKAMKDNVKDSMKVKAMPARDGNLKLFLDLAETESVEGSIIVPVLNGEAQVWLYEDSMYIRTRYKHMMFPDAKQKSTSGNGMNVFRVDDLRPILTFSHDGIERFVQLDDDVIVQSLMSRGRNEFLKDGRRKGMAEKKEGKSGYYSAQ